MNRKFFTFIFFVFLHGYVSAQDIDPFNVGDIGPGGGIVFYEKNDWTDGWKYLEAAPRTWLNGVPTLTNRTNDLYQAFGDSGTSGNQGFINQTFTGIGSGDVNTLRIASNGNNFSNSFFNNVYGGKRGWYLPSRDELRELYNFKNQNGNDFLQLNPSAYYNSSTDPFNANIAWLINMDTGVGGYSGKGGGQYKRAVRKISLNDVQPTENKSLKFSTFDSSVNFGNTIHLEQTPTRTRQYLFWIKPEGSGYIFSKYKNLDATNSDYFARYDASSEKIIFTSNGTGAVADIGGVALNNWSFVTITIRQTDSGNEMKGYVNGVLKVTQNINVSETIDQQNFYLGYNPNLYRNDSVSGSFKGYLDEFSIWEWVGQDYFFTQDPRPFNEEEILSYMDEKPNGYEHRLIFYLDFDSENFLNQSKFLTDIQAVTLNPEENIVQYSRDVPYEYELAPTDLGFLVNGSSVNEILINSDSETNTTIAELSATDPDTSLDNLVFTLDNNSGNQNYNSRFEINNRNINILFSPGLGKEDDTDVDAFLTSANINNLQIKQALNTFVSKLKEDQIWEKFEAIYPFVGGSSNSTSINLKDPTAFQITWPNDFTFSDSFIRSSGTSSADTGIGVKNTNLSSENSSVSIYVSSNEQGIIDIGGISGAKGIQLISRNPSDEWGGKMYSSENSLYDTDSSIGFYQASRNNTESFFLQRNLERNEVQVSAVLPDASPNLTIGGLATNGYSAKDYSYASAGTALTEEEMDSYFSYVNQLQVDLGRISGVKSSVRIDEPSTYNIDILVSDGQRQFRKTLNVNVINVNSAPTASEVTVSTDEDTSVDITLLGADIDGDTLTYTTTAPSNGTLSGTGSAITYTPDVNYEGTDSFTYTVNDGTVDSETATVTITIYPVNDVPIATDVTATTDEDTSVLIDLQGTDIDGDSLVFVGIGSPTNGTVIINNGQANYTPNENFEGTDSFTYVANDGTVDSSEATVTITVAAVNDTPTVSEVTVSTDEDTSVDITLLGADIDGDTLTYTTTAPSNGTLSGTGSAITYTPDVNYEGTDSFTYTVNDGTVDSETATVTITIYPVNDVPIATDVTATTDEDTSVLIDLQGTDIDGDSLVFVGIGSPTNGTVIINNGQANYTPNENFEGTDSFTYVANDGTVDSSEATVTITVAAVNDTPTVSEVTVSTDEDTSVDITLLGADIDGDTLTYTTTAPSNGTLSGTGSAITYTPDVNYEGTDSFTYTVNDGTVDSETATVTITIYPVNDVPIATDVTATTDEDTSVLIDLQGTDIDGDSLVFVGIGSPTNGTVIINNGQANYTPNENFEGTDSFTYVANDGTVDSSEATVTITVAAVNDTPTVSEVTVSTDEDTSVDITLLGADIDGDTLTYTTTAPSNGTLSGTGSAITYTPDVNYEGTDSFTYTVNDGTVDSETATVTITIYPVNDVPIATDVTATTDEDTSVVEIFRGSDIDGDSLVFVKFR